MNSFDWGSLVDYPAAELEEAIERAAEIVTTYTWDPGSRSIFSPENLDYKAKLLVPLDTPIRNRIPRTGGVGEAASWLKMTSKLDPTVGGTATSIFFADGAEPGETTQTYSSATQAYKLLGRKIQIGIKAIEASKGRPGGLGTKLEDRTNVKMLEIMLGEEQAIIAGDSDADSSSFDGFYDQVTTNSGSLTLVSVSGMQTHFGTLFDAGSPGPDLLVFNSRQARALADDLEKGGSVQRIVLDTAGGVVSGAKVRAIINEINGSEVEVVTSRYVGATAMLITFRTPAGENCIEMEDLVSISAVDKDLSGLALTRYLYEISALKVIAEPFQMKFAGLATS